MNTTLSPISEVKRPTSEIEQVRWDFPQSSPREFEAFLCEEEEGGFSILAVNYPGVISQGDTEGEAKANIAEAFMAVLESRRKHGEKMAYSFEPIEAPAACKRVRIAING